MRGQNGVVREEQIRFEWVGQFLQEECLYMF